MKADWERGGGGWKDVHKGFFLSHIDLLNRYTQPCDNTS